MANKKDEASQGAYRESQKIGGVDAQVEGPNGFVPDAKEGENKPDSQPNDPLQGEVLITSEERKGKTIVAVTGKPIIFDSDGKAYVSPEDALYLKQCPGFAVG